MTTQTYHDAAFHLLAQAETELQLGDARQASEQGWGAATQIFKAICERRGWQRRNYKALAGAVNRLEEETGDLEIRLLFRSANLLHVNFYEDAEEPQIVADGLGDVRRFIAKFDDIY